MNRRRTIVGGLFWAISIGGLLAVATGNQRAVSLRIWLAGFVLWFAFVTMQRLFDQVPLVPSTVRPLVSVRRKPKLREQERLREQRSLEVLLLRSRDNERAFDQQLRPRLHLLAEHYLPVSHGIDPTAEPERVVELFGPAAWILDAEVVDRRPTIDEVQHFVAVLNTSPGSPPGGAA